MTKRYRLTRTQNRRLAHRLAAEVIDNALAGRQRHPDPRYADAASLRARAERRAPPLVRSLGPRARAAGQPGVRALALVLRALERCLVPPPHIERFVAEHRQIGDRN